MWWITSYILAEHEIRLLLHPPPTTPREDVLWPYPHESVQSWPTDDCDRVKSFIRYLRSTMNQAETLPMIGINDEIIKGQARSRHVSTINLLIILNTVTAETRWILQWSMVTSFYGNINYCHMWSSVGGLTGLMDWLAWRSQEWHHLCMVKWNDIPVVDPACTAIEFIIDMIATTKLLF